MKVGITDFDAPNVAYAGETFDVYITIQNNRILPVVVSVRVDLLNGALECIKKNIGEENHLWRPGKSSETKKIQCIVREGDIDWYREEYNVKAVLYRDFPLMGRSYLRDSSTVRGIHVKSRFIEKDKVRILNVNVKEEVKENEKGEVKFNVKINVTNEGHYNVSAWVRIDMVEKPSVIPELEEYIGIKGFAAERKELGRSEGYEGIKSKCRHQFVVPCYIRRTEIEKERFNIEAVLFVNIDGMEYQVDSSTLYGIYHKQPICREEGCWFIVGIVLGCLIAICFIIMMVRRILNPLYRFRKKRKF